MVLFALVAGWKGDGLHSGSRRGHADAGAGNPILPPPERARCTTVRRKGVYAAYLDGVQRRRRARPWFICLGAGCGRRVAILYGEGKYFLYRHCYVLIYEGQRDNVMYRALHKASSIREKLGGSANMM